MLKRQSIKDEVYGLVTKGLTPENKIKALMQAGKKFGLEVTPADIRKMIMGLIWDKYEAYVRCRFQHDPNTCWELINWIDANCQDPSRA
jgi:hypothetical protein